MHRHTVILQERMRDVTRAAPPGDRLRPKARANEIASQAVVAADAVALQDLRQALAEFTTSLNEQRLALTIEIAQASVELAVQIAERLIGAEITANRQRLDQIVLTSLERIQASRAIAVKANPLDLQLLRQQLVENAVPERHTELLTFQPDDACPRGRLKLETDERFIEWDTQRALVELRGALFEEIHAENVSQ